MFCMFRLVGDSGGVGCVCVCGGGGGVVVTVCKLFAFGEAFMTLVVKLKTLALFQTFLYHLRILQK